jgi:hypothetical protein
MFALLFSSPEPKPEQQSRNERCAKRHVVCQNPHEVIPSFLQGVFLEHRRGVILNSQPVHVNDSGVGEDLQRDEQQSEDHQCDPAYLAQRESNRESSNAAKTDLPQVRRELIEDFLIHARSISIFWCDPGECIQNGTELETLGFSNFSLG